MPPQLTISNLGVLYGLYAQDRSERNELILRFAQTRENEERSVAWLARQEGFQNGVARI